MKREFFLAAIACDVVACVTVAPAWTEQELIAERNDTLDGRMDGWWSCGMFRPKVKAQTGVCCRFPGVDISRSLKEGGRNTSQRYEASACASAG